MRLGYLLLLVLLIAGSAGGQRLGQKTDKRVSWLSKNAVRLRSIDPADTDFADLAKLKKLIGNARIVQLGEQTHGDGATFRAKIRLIKYLHEKLGFDVLAFESGLYGCRKAWEAIRSGAEPQKAASLGVFGIWTQSMQVGPLWEYLAQRAKTKRPLELCGFDCQITGGAAQGLAGELAAVVGGDSEELTRVRQLVERLAEGKAPVDWETEGEACRAAVRELIKGLDARKHAYWQQLLRSLIAYAELRGAPPQGSLAERFNPRDDQMGKNMVWLAKHAYPKRKIIVWAATMHIQRDPHLIDTQRASLDYTGVRPMGQLVHEELGKDVFTVGFTTYEGAVGRPWTESQRIARASAGSLEDLCVRAGLENAVIPLRGLPRGSWLNKPVVSRPLGNSEMRARWPRILDAMVFTKTMTPSTRFYTKAEVAKRRDFLATVAQSWQRWQARTAQGHAYADKGNFNADWKAWHSLFAPDAARIREMERQLRAWHAKQPQNASLDWRFQSLLGQMAADLGDDKAARSYLRAAVAAYPEKTYRDPRTQSSFQHVVNAAAKRIRDARGLAAAQRFAFELLASDSRYRYFFDVPWRRMLDEKTAPVFYRGLIAAYEKRAANFPQEAAAIRMRIRGLRDAQGGR